MTAARKDTIKTIVRVQLVGRRGHTKNRELTTKRTTIRHETI